MPGAVSSGGMAGTGAAGSGGQGASGGSAGNGASPSYIIGADITSVQAAEARGATYSDGTKQDIVQLLKKHGFNYIRLRTFVDPKAADGYDRQDGYADLAHTISFGKRVKAAGLGLLLDFHYSDNWADPGKQCVPIAWQGYTTIEQLATALHDYTKDAITQLVPCFARSIGLPALSVIWTCVTFAASKPASSGCSFGGAASSWRSWIATASPTCAASSTIRTL